MIIKINNLGIVAEARVDLGKDFIILTGENNTGKTYVAYTLYQLLNLDHEKLPRDKKNSPASISNSIGSLLKEGLSQLFAYDGTIGASLFKETRIELLALGKEAKDKSPHDFARKYLPICRYLYCTCRKMRHQYF